MATIRKRNNSYQIRVSCGYNSNYEQIVKTKTWKPERGMTQKQIDKELQRQAVLFEEQCMTGQFLDGNITLAEFADKWITDYAEQQYKTRTLYDCKDKLKRILPELGHIKLARLQPHHLLEFYKKLAAPGARHDIKYKPPSDFLSIINKAGYTQQSLADKTNVSRYTIQSCCSGRNISEENAIKICQTLKRKRLFTAVNSEKRLSDRTISGYHRTLSIMMTTAVYWQIIPSNPCTRVKPPRTERKEAPVLDEKQAAELIRCLQNEPLKFKTAVMLLLYTGLRRGELCGLEWNDVDFEHGLITVNKSVLYLPQTGVFEDSTKNQSSNRVMHIPNDMIMLLKEYRSEQLQLRLLMGDLWQNSGKVFTSENGSMINPTLLTSQFKSFIKRHNLPNIHLHTLRHTSATLLIAGGVDVATVSKRLGHADKTTTLNIYTHAIKSADEAASEKLQLILNPFKTEKAN